MAFAAVSWQRPAQARGSRRPLSFSSSQSESMRRIISGLVSCSGFSARSLSNASIMILGRRIITAWVSFGGLPTKIFPLGGVENNIIYPIIINRTAQEL